jgi:membrane protein implicated in regulation of membrane protease activity
MMPVLEEIVFWHWWAAAIVFVVIEVFAPGAIFLWLGVSAGVVGALLLVLPAMTWQIQMLVFAVLSISAIVGWRVFQKANPTQTDQPSLNRRGEQYVGRTLTLDEPIVNGQGKIRVDDTTWKVEGDDMPGGVRVTVIGVENVVLRVAPVEPSDE